MPPPGGDSLGQSRRFVEADTGRRGIPDCLDERIDWGRALTGFLGLRDKGLGGSTTKHGGVSVTGDPKGTIMKNFERHGIDHVI